MQPEGYHVGIILDGNGRWAKALGKPRLFGHNAGAKNLERIARACPEHTVAVLTVYAFAIANWKRDKDEVSGLWKLFHHFFDIEIKKIITNNVRVRMIGRRDEIPKDVMERIVQVENETKNNTGLVLQVALNYDGLDEVARALQTVGTEIEAGKCRAKDVTVDQLRQHLDTAGVPDPDIIIRTGMSEPEGNHQFSAWRSSSFLQLQSAQAVCVSTPILWPDFSPEDLAAAIQFAKPDERLFGGQRK